MAVLSEECVLALQAATAAACHVEALNSAPPGELWKHVLYVVHSIIRAHTRKHIDRRSCVARLPAELLVRIFQHLPLWDRVRAAAVCQRWRTVSLGAVSLWSDIPSLQNVDNYERLLCRAGDSPVSLTYWPEDLDALELFFHILSLNRGRIKNLRFILPERREEDESLDSAADLDGVLSGNTPILESLVLWHSREILSGAYPTLPILQSPMLRAIELSGFHPSYLEVCADSPVLHTLTISPPETYEMFRADDWSRFTQFPLQLQVVFTADIPPHSPRLSHSLNHLYLRVHPGVFAAIAQIEDLSRLQTLDISFMHRHTDILGTLQPNQHPHAPWLAALLPSIVNTTVSAAVHFSELWFSLRAVDSAGRKRIFREVNLIEGDWHSLLSNVTKLWIDAYTIIPATAAVPAAFPALEELTLGATRPTVFTFGDPPSLVNLPLAWPPISCPRLRVVRVVSETEPQILPAGDMLDYLKRPCPRLESLIFDGVALSPHPGAALDALAENVAMLQSAEVPPESYSVWAHPRETRSSF